jgi:hypothetical protein
MNMKNLIIALMAVILITACEDQLNIPPKSNLELGNFFATVEDLIWLLRVHTIPLRCTRATEVLAPILEAC